MRLLPLLAAGLVLAACTSRADSSHLCEPPGAPRGGPGAAATVVHALDAPPKQLDDGWPVSTLAAEGFDPAPIADLVAQIDDRDYTKLDGILIARHGKLVFEAYFNGFDRETKHDTRSAFKSITSALTGIALDKAVIDDIDRPISETFPDYWPSIQGDPRAKNGITLAHLLTMTPGFDAEENWGVGPYREDDMWDSADWIRFTLDLPMAHTPGAQFSYNSSTTFLIGQVIARAAGEPLPAFAKRELFAPLGITDYCWTLTAKRRAVAQGSFFMRPRDMLKIGQLFLDRGTWHGERILSDRWIHVSTRSHVDAARPDPARTWPSGSGYGYQWWTEQVRPGEDFRILRYFASGNGGQKIFVFPKLDMVVVFTGSNYNRRIGHQQPRWILERSIWPAVLN